MTSLKTRSKIKVDYLFHRLLATVRKYKEGRKFKELLEEVPLVDNSKHKVSGKTPKEVVAPTQ
jgi:hypothetical protein